MVPLFKVKNDRHIVIRDIEWSREGEGDIQLLFLRQAHVCATIVAIPLKMNVLCIWYIDTLTCIHYCIIVSYCIVVC